SSPSLLDPYYRPSQTGTKLLVRRPSPRACEHVPAPRVAACVRACHNCCFSELELTTKACSERLIPLARRQKLVHLELFASWTAALAILCAVSDSPKPDTPGPCELLSSPPVLATESPHPAAPVNGRRLQEPATSDIALCRLCRPRRCLTTTPAPRLAPFEKASPRFYRLASTSNVRPVAVRPLLGILLAPLPNPLPSSPQLPPFPPHGAARPSTPQPPAAAAATAESGPPAPALALLPAHCSRRPRTAIPPPASHPAVPRRPTAIHARPTPRPVLYAAATSAPLPCAFPPATTSASSRSPAAAAAAAAPCSGRCRVYTLAARPSAAFCVSSAFFPLGVGDGACEDGGRAGEERGRAWGRRRARRVGGLFGPFEVAPGIGWAVGCSVTPSNGYHPPPKPAPAPIPAPAPAPAPAPPPQSYYPPSQTQHHPYSTLRPYPHATPQQPVPRPPPLSFLNAGQYKPPALSTRSHARQAKESQGGMSMGGAGGAGGGHGAIGGGVRPIADLIDLTNSPPPLLTHVTHHPAPGA
ncbi:hypothetical protein BDK51DRAFT_42430, partial [Blyttiomyces helicus]